MRHKQGCLEVLLKRRLQREVRQIELLSTLAPTNHRIGIGNQRLHGFAGGFRVLILHGFPNAFMQMHRLAIFRISLRGEFK